MYHRFHSCLVSSCIHPSQQSLSHPYNFLPASFVSQPAPIAKFCTVAKNGYTDRLCIPISYTAQIDTYRILFRFSVPHCAQDKFRMILDMPLRHGCSFFCIMILYGTDNAFMMCNNRRNRRIQLQMRHTIPI